MRFPFEVLQVPGDQALAKLAELQTDCKFYPVILGDADAFERMRETFEDDDQSLDELIAAANAIDPEEWFREREVSEPEYYEIEDSGWPEEEQAPSNRLSAHCDVLTGEPYQTVYIALIPASESWMVPCHLRIGGWNECPGAEEHAAIYKYWGEKYGAKVVCIADDVIEFQVARPPVTREAALALAKEHFLFCADIVHQGTETLETLAASLLDAKIWYFWWD